MTSDLSCVNITDRFSVSNERAKLDYKVGLLSIPEFKIQNNFKNQNYNEDYWLSSPYIFQYDHIRIAYKTRNGFLQHNPTFSEHGVNPSISLKPEVKFISGTGTMADPYVVDTN